MRLIDADEVHNLVRNSKKYMWRSPSWTEIRVTVSADDIQFGVDKIQTVDVEPVKHGHWGKTNDGAAYCTACKRKLNDYVYGYPRCPMCGARMDEVSE